MQWSLFLLFVVGQSSFITCHLYEYHYVTEEKSWTEAQEYCRKHHTDLATISNMRDMERLMTSANDHKESAWIGLYNQPSCPWKWSLPGVEFSESETNWGENQPDNKKGNEFCGIIWPNLKWADAPCDEKRFFICYDEENTSHRFFAIEQEMNWFEAQSYCRENHKDLASGPQQLNDQELREQMRKLNDTYKCKTTEENYKQCDPFIGLFRDSGLVCDVEWKWSDGSSFSFRHWKESVQEKSSQKCAMTMLKEDGNKWDAGDCGEKKPFFCHDDKVILVQKKMTWEDALYYCQEHHHDLVSITDLDEQRWVQEKVKNANTEYVWMGLRYTCTPDFWFWVSDEVVSYENWDSGQTMDDCDMSGAMSRGGGHKWFKRNDMEKFNFLCSRSEPTLLTAYLLLLSLWVSVSL